MRFSNDLQPEKPARHAICRVSRRLQAEQLIVRRALNEYAQRRAPALSERDASIAERSPGTFSSDSLSGFAGRPASERAEL